MSGLQLIYLVTVFCVVNAAVTVNIYEEDSNSNETDYKDEFDNEIEGEQNSALLKKHCRPEICNHHCQIQGYSGGSCKSGRCVCNQNDDLYHEKVNELKSCNYQACDQLCRRLGFPGGVCVGDRCKCDNFKNELNLQNINELKSCNYQACDQLCRRLGFPGGVCVGDRCKCDNFKNELNLQNIDELKSCNYQACDQLCRRLGFPGGVCVGDRCKCDNFKNELTSHIINTKEVDLNEVSENNKENEMECSNSACEINCQSLGLPGGYCIDGQCICYKNSKVRSLRTCDVVACNDMCHRMGYIVGMCRQGSCYCY
ncbi:unnamed protein product [Danaus chrysippus]|uniref:(African queen) hypothetical protein n=1 Tax=Danaus chrysippus TaxID=151541 RepID=A0A8J2VR80_9NEOP|nr:unnamed protein product [Danaus chrysippus]